MREWHLLALIEIEIACLQKLNFIKIDYTKER